MEAKKIKISLLENNSGQIEGLPKNPRFIKDARFEALKKSIEDFPDMLEMREAIVMPHGKAFVVIGGNMRMRACKALGHKEMWCKVLPPDTPAERLREIAIKDNIGFGNDDHEALANEWDSIELADWGLELPTQIDYSLLDEVSEEDEQLIQDLANGVKKAIQIEFEPEHYDEAKSLVSEWRKKGLYIGGFLVEKLKEIDRN